MTELATVDHTTGEIDFLSADVPSLYSWVRDSEAAYKVAEIVCRTTFVPDHFRGKPADVTAAIMTCQEMRIPIMAGLRGINVIKGTPAFSANMQVALVQREGHQVEQVEATDTRAVFRCRRKGSLDWQEVVWDESRAKKLGVFDRNPEYKKQPRSMYSARAKAECARLVGADVLMAVPYSSEELSDGIDSLEVLPAKATATRTRKIQRAPIEPAKVLEPELEAPTREQVKNPETTPGDVETDKLNPDLPWDEQFEPEGE